MQKTAPAPGGRSGQHANAAPEVTPLGEKDSDGGPPPGVNLELLVHGVGGTTPADMLQHPFPERVTGDETAAVYRRPEDTDAEQRPADYAEEPVAEAYSWSNLTSGNGARALWLILLPFMVANLAHWMRPAADGRQLLVRVHGLLVRLVALSLTVLLVAACCEVALDLVAWQCAGHAACTAENSWLGFLGVNSGGHGGWWSQPGRRLTLAAVLPTALTLLLWWLSHRTWCAYESQAPLQRPVAEDELAAADRPALCLPGFWYGKRLVARLRAAHTAAGLLTVAAALAGPTVRQDIGTGGGPLAGLAGWPVSALICVVAGGVLYVVCRRGRKESRADDTVDGLIVRTLPGAAAGVLLLAAGYAMWSRPGWTSAGRDLPMDQTFGVVAVSQGALVVAIAVLGMLLYRRQPVPRTALRGLGSAAVAMVACALGGLMSGGVAQRVADWLDGPGSTGDSGGLLRGPPLVLTWQASTIPVLLGVVLVLGCLLGWRTARRTRELTAEVNGEYADSPTMLPDETRTRRIAGTVARARLTDTAPRLVGLLALITLLLGGVAVLGTWLTGTVPSTAARGTPALVEGFAATVQALGSWMIGLAFLLFFAWGRRAYTDASARRTVGILWDVGTFWPRAAHPFAPPCYAERAVPDLAWRIATWTGRTGGRLVLSGHSQGSVLSAAALWQLDPGTRRQVALLTYGSPLERLYGRWFPAYFGPAQLRHLHGEVDCWRNLWRRTDPVGGPVRTGGSDGRPEVDHGPLRDPLAYGRTVEHPLPAPILGHSDYPADPAFSEERDLLLRRLRKLSREGTRREVEATGATGATEATEATEDTALPAHQPSGGEHAPTAGEFTGAPAGRVPHQEGSPPPEAPGGDGEVPGDGRPQSGPRAAEPTAEGDPDT